MELTNQTILYADIPDKYSYIWSLDVLRNIVGQYESNINLRAGKFGTNDLTVPYIVSGDVFDLRNISHSIKSLKVENNKLIADISINNNRAGRALQNHICNYGTVGVFQVHGTIVIRNSNLALVEGIDFAGIHAV
jgi:hypothetical protein